jgi:hypothetical protein
VISRSAGKAVRGRQTPLPRTRSGASLASNRTATPWSRSLHGHAGSAVMIALPTPARRNRILSERAVQGFQLQFRACDCAWDTYRLAVHPCAWSRYTSSVGSGPSIPTPPETARNPISTSTSTHFAMRKRSGGAAGPGSVGRVCVARPGGGHEAGTLPLVTINDARGAVTALGAHNFQAGCRCRGNWTVVRAGRVEPAGDRRMRNAWYRWWPPGTVAGPGAGCGCRSGPGTGVGRRW